MSRPPAAAADERVRSALAPVIELLASDPSAPSAVTDGERAWAVHVADSLSALELPPVTEARKICDLGSGAGFPGLPLAAALPRAEVDLLDSVSRKCAFMERALAASGLGNARVVCARAEEWAASAGREHYDLVAARAVGRLSTLAELASPLLASGGYLLAWKGRRDPDEEAELERAAERLAMDRVETRWVGPYAGSRNRHLHLLRKSGPTPGDLPRRPGMAKKRPRGTT